MKWKYYIPHLWESPEERTTRVDVWLLPEESNVEGKFYWFTLNALSVEGAGVEGEYPHDSEEGVREMNLQLLGDRDYLITPLFDIVARVEDFNMHELREWTELFIRVQFGDAEPVLVEGEFEDFSAPNSHVSEIGRIAAAVQAGVPEEEIINYQPTDIEDPYA